jgi:hypothetical protein
MTQDAASDIDVLNSGNRALWLNCHHPARPTESFPQHKLSQGFADRDFAARLKPAEYRMTDVIVEQPHGLLAGNQRTLRDQMQFLCGKVSLLIWSPMRTEATFKSLVHDSRDARIYDE